MTRGGFSVRFVRIVLAAVVSVDLLSFFFFIADARSAALARDPALRLLVDLLSRAPVTGAVVLIGIVCAIGFGRKPGSIWHGLLALGALTLLSTVHAQLFGSPWRHMYYSGLCLAGWLLGLAYSRRYGGTTSDESYARVGSMALLGSAYLNAGISKLAYGGFDWATGLPIQAVIIGQDGLVRDSILSMYRSLVATTPAFAALLSVVTIGLELAGPLMIVGRKTRLPVALGLFAMHANIYVLTPILYWQSMLYLLLFGLSADEPDVPPLSQPSFLTDNRKFVVLAVVLAVTAFAGIEHQGRRWAASREWQAHDRDPTPVSEPPTMVPAPPSEPVPPSVSPAPSLTPIPSATPLQRIGPFTVGATITTGWSVDSITLGDRGFTVTLSGAPGRARFDVTCAPSPYRSPFDLEDAHIFYSNDLKFQDLQAAGLALQEQIRKAAQGHEACADIARWQAALQAEPPTPNQPKLGH